MLLCGATSVRMVQYLMKITNKDKEPKKPFKGYSGSWLLSSLITSGLYDVALLVLGRYPNLAVCEPSPLNEIAQNPSAFPSGARFNFLQRFIYMSDLESPAESPVGSAKCAAGSHGFKEDPLFLVC